MKPIIEPNCYNLEAVNSVASVMEAFLNEALKQQTKTSLDYFVIADADDKNFAETVNKYATLVGTDTHITQDGSYFTAGKSLDGIDKNGVYHQAIVIRSSVWVCAAYELLCDQGLLNEEIKKQMKTPEKMSLLLILHELGHVLDNENQYKMFGEVNTKVGYDLRHEYDEYARETALSLWGEYYAESFATYTIQANPDAIKDNEENLIECIRSYSFGIDTNSLMQRAFRILYFFVLRIACIHQYVNYSSAYDYSRLKQSSELSDYVSPLKSVELEMLKLLKSYPNWSSKEQLNTLSRIFKDFVSFEYNRQKN